MIYQRINKLLSRQVILLMRRVSNFLSFRITILKKKAFGSSSVFSLKKGDLELKKTLIPGD